MIKFSYFLQVFLQVIFAQQILSSAIFQLRLADLQSLVTDRQQEARRAIEEVLHRDGAFVSKHHRCQRNFANVFIIFGWVQIIFYAWILNSKYLSKIHASK